MLLILFLLVQPCLFIGGKGTDAPSPTDAGISTTSPLIKPTVPINSATTLHPAICSQPVGACLADQCPGQYDCRDGFCYPLCCDLGDYCEAWKQNGFCENEYTKNDVARFCNHTCGIC